MEPSRPLILPTPGGDQISIQILGDDTGAVFARVAVLSTGESTDRPLNEFYSWLRGFADLFEEAGELENAALLRRVVDEAENGND